MPGVLYSINATPTPSSERRRETHGADHEEHLGGLATEDQKLDSDTGAAGDVAADGRAAAVSTKEPPDRRSRSRAKAPRSYLAGADAGGREKSWMHTLTKAAEEGDLAGDTLEDQKPHRDTSSNEEVKLP